MGGIWGSREFFSDALTEIAGFKAGVVLTERELFDIMCDEGDVARILNPNGPGGGRIDSSTFQEAVVTLLHRLGNTPEDNNIPITIQMYHRYRKTDQEGIYDDLMKAYRDFMEAELAKPGKRMLDPTPMMLAIHGQHGMQGVKMSLELIEGINRDLHRSAWGSIRNVEWRDTVELNGLFKDAGLETQHARFFDQRYIDFLGANFEQVDAMHWRKFEGFTAEYFERDGYRVVLGPGSNDGGVDLRVYPADADHNLPPMILVQCKRQRARIDKVLVKSVFADVLEEGAGSGLIVTTSTLSPGAETTRTARNYPVEAADRATIRSWIEKLRS